MLMSETSEPQEDDRTEGEHMTTEQTIATLTYEDYLRAARYAGQPLSGLVSREKR